MTSAPIPCSRRYDPACSWPGRLPAACLLLLLVLLLAGGCSSIWAPRQTQPSPHQTAAPAHPAVDSTGLAMAQTAPSAARQAQAELVAFAADSSSYDPETMEWEELYRLALSHISDQDYEQAEDLLFVMQDRVGHALETEADSLTTARRNSMSRRLVHLGGLIAEGQAFDGRTADWDSALAAGYERFESLAFPDSLVPITGHQRRALAADLLQVDNPAVQRWMDYFTGPGRRQYAHWLKQKAAADSLIGAILADANLPYELIYLAMIESGLSSHARSGVGAVGPWQFMPGTGKRYGLRTDWWVDQRRDLELATRAAARYLAVLYEEFQDWALVLAAYNAGEHRISRAIRRGGHDNFWKLHLPSQTADHIPKFIAAARIGEHPADYGFDIEPVGPISFDTVLVDDSVDLAVVARCAGATKQEVLSLNPSLLRRTSPPDSPDYPVRVPMGTGQRCRHELAKIPPEERLTWRRHRVARGETLSQIASDYGTTVADLREVNRVKNVNMIRPGDQLLIPMPAQLKDKARRRAVEKGHYVPPDGYVRVSYSVKKGDTLSGIARKLQVSLKHLRRVNGLNGSLIKPGQRLYAYRPSRAG